MPDIKLSDGKKIPFSKKIDGFEIAAKIGKSLAKDACIMSVDGELKDLSFSIEKKTLLGIWGGELRFLELKNTTFLLNNTVVFP